MSVSTLEIARRLIYRGFTPSQAEALAEELLEFGEEGDPAIQKFATQKFSSSKSNELEIQLIKEIGGVREDMGKLRSETSTEISKLRSETTAEFGSVRAEFGSVRAEIGSVRGDIGHLKADLLKCFIGMQFTSLGLMFGFIYFLIKH